MVSFLCLILGYISILCDDKICFFDDSVDSDPSSFQFQLLQLKYYLLQIYIIDTI